jgi:hypothetical protein
MFVLPCVLSGKQMIFIAAYHLITGMFLFEEVVRSFSPSVITGHTLNAAIKM